MQAFTHAAKRLIAVHGTSIVYNAVTTGVYDANTLTVQNTSTPVSLKAYTKNIKVTQYNYPNLVGKEVFAFLIEATTLGITPKPNDFITFNSKKYVVTSLQSHYAVQDLIYYTVLGVKS